MSHLNTNLHKVSDESSLHNLHKVSDESSLHNLHKVSDESSQHPPAQSKWWVISTQPA